MNKYLEKIAKLTDEQVNAISEGKDSYGVQAGLWGLGTGMAASLGTLAVTKDILAARAAGQIGSLAGMGIGAYRAHSHNEPINRMEHGTPQERKAYKDMMISQGPKSTLGRTVGMGLLNIPAGVVAGVESYKHNEERERLLRDR